jgi:hypothetical protein
MEFEIIEILYLKYIRNQIKMITRIIRDRRKKKLNKFLRKN